MTLSRLVNESRRLIFFKSNNTLKVLFSTQRYKVPRHPGASAGDPGSLGGDNGSSQHSLLRKSYDWMIKKHGIHDSQSTVLSSTDNGYGNPFIVEQPDFNDVPPNWWEKRTNEEKVFIYATSVLSFLGFIYATDCYYESKNELHPITILITKYLPNEMDARAKRIAEIELEFDKAVARVEKTEQALEMKVKNYLNRIFNVDRFKAE